MRHIYMYMYCRNIRVYEYDFMIGYTRREYAFPYYPATSRGVTTGETAATATDGAIIVSEQPQLAELSLMKSVVHGCTPNCKQGLKILNLAEKYCK